MRVFKYCIFFVIIVSLQISFSKENGKSSEPFVEFSIPIKIWEPVNDNNDPASFNWDGFSNNLQLRILFENIQEIYNEGIPINLALWDAPDWIVVNPDSSKNRELLDDMTNELVESICAFVVHLRDKYNADIKSVNITPRETNWSNLVLTTEQRDDIIKETDKRFKALRLETEFKVNLILSKKSGPQLIAKDIPADFALAQSYPNPFNPETTIEYQLSEIGKVTLEIYDLTGRKVKTLLNQEQSAGSYSIMWDGMNDMGSKVSSGIYLCRIRIESDSRLFIDHKKMIFYKQIK